MAPRHRILSDPEIFRGGDSSFSLHPAAVATSSPNSPMRRPTMQQQQAEYINLQQQQHLASNNGDEYDDDEEEDEEGGLYVNQVLESLIPPLVFFHVLRFTDRPERRG